jgi:hypothetical protein
MREFKARRGFHLTNKMAQVYGEHIDKIMKDGEITADELLNDAASISSPLHGFFSWGEGYTNSGKQHLLYRARTMLRAIEVIVPGSNKRVRAYPFICGRYVDIRRAYGDAQMIGLLKQEAERVFQSAADLYQEKMDAIDAVKEGGLNQ